MRRRERHDARFEHRAAERRQRARAHLARVRARSGAPRRRGLLAVALTAASLACGALVGDRAAAGIARWLAPEPPQLTTIHVRGTARLSALEVAAASGVDRGASLASLDAAGAARALRANAWVADARAVALPWIWGGDLLLEVTEREPAAVVALAREDFLVDASGTPFAPAGPDDVAGLPRLEPADPPEPGAPRPELARAVALVQRLPVLGLAPPERVWIAAGPAGFALELPGLGPRVLLGRDAPESALERLARVLASGRPELARAAALDLRFADQAVLRDEFPRGSAQEATARGRAPSSIPTG